MPRLAAVCDTNVYRSTGVDLWEWQRTREVAHGVLGYACYGVVTELLAHISDPEGEDHLHAWAALARLREHCSDYDGSATNLRLVSHAVPQIAYTLFQKDIAPPDHPPFYGHLVGRLVDDRASLRELLPSLRAVAEAADQARGRYVTDLWNRVVLPLAPDATSWADVARKTPARTTMLEKVRRGEHLPFIAAGLANQAAKAADLTLSDEELAQAAQRAYEQYTTVVHYRGGVLRHVIETGADMSKRARANGVVDLHVCAATSIRAAIAGMPLIVVTDDKDILDAATDAETRPRFLSPAEYRERLSLSFTDFCEYAESFRPGGSGDDAG